MGAERDNLTGCDSLSNAGTKALVTKVLYREMALLVDDIA